MLRIRIELIPDGDESRARELGRAQLSNISSLSAVSDYAIYVCEGVNIIAETGRWERRGVIGRHDRRGSVWALAAKVAIWAAGEAAKL
jgi:hypothetical protein